VGNSWACPEGTKACSTSTSKSYTLCYPPADHSTLCPILYMEFVPRSDNFISKLSSADQSKIKIQYFDDKTDLVFSRHLVNSLPYTDTLLERSVCKSGIIVNMYHDNPNIWYPLEKDKSKGLKCKETDTRFVKLGFKISALDLLELNGVNDILKQQPMFDHYLTQDDAKK
jgi:hypothetical protein